jgi:hypothetical protein
VVVAVKASAKNRNKADLLRPLTDGNRTRNSGLVLVEKNKKVSKFSASEFFHK